MRDHRWGRIAAGVVLAAGCLACGDSEKPRKKSALDDDEPAAPMSSEERARSRQEDATKLCAKLQAAGAKEAMEPHAFEIDEEFYADGGAEEKNTCAKMLVVLQRDAPATYWKLAECARNEDKARSCASDVKYNDEGYKKSIETLKEETKRDKIEKLAQITLLKTTPVVFKVRSYGDERTVTLDLPANLNEGSDSLPAFIQWKETSDAKKGPSLSVRDRYSMPTLEDALRSASSDKVIKQEKTDQGYVLATETSYSLEVSVVQKLPPSDYSQPAMECEARFADSRAIAAKDKIIPWLEKLCTMKISK